jgi:hypothetical protein
MSDNQLPDLDTVAGHAGFLLAQIIALRLVKEGIIPKKTMMDDIRQGAAFFQKAPNLTAAQRAAAHFLVQTHDLLQTADKSGAS